MSDIAIDVKRGEVVGRSAVMVPAKVHCLAVLHIQQAAVLNYMAVFPAGSKHALSGDLLVACRRAGTGLHPELTGHENVHLNGTHLGIQLAIPG